MGLFSFLGVGSRPAPAPAASSAPVAAAPTAPAADAKTTAPTNPVALNDTFETGAAEPAMCSIDGSGPNACFPSDWSSVSGGGGGKRGVIVEGG